MMRNPLGKRLKRELLNSLGKYLTLFLLMTLSIGFVSGFLVADNSMILAYADSFEKYNIEDGHFAVQKKLNKAQIRRIEEEGISVFENFYSDIPFDNGTRIRVFQARDQVNLICLMEGEMPVSEDEIAIDRMYADNNHLKPGDRLSGAGKEWTVSGLIALSDYSCLFENNNDTMFDSIQFGAAAVSPSAFEKLPADNMKHCYAWKYDEPYEDDVQQKKMADDLLKRLSPLVRLEDYVPRYQNQAIMFTGDDMGSDKAMMETLLYIIILILAFVFAVTINDTISRESAVIGTLRASGYTKGELIRHYMTMPLLVTLCSAAAGNLAGYTFMKEVCAGMYYGSYSLPTYVTIFNSEAFLKTTFIPVIIMLGVTYFSLRRKLRFSPLAFLRHDISGKKKGKAVKLPHALPFLSRFRMRIILQNAGSYLVLAAGITFANVLLLFGLALPSLLECYQELVTENMISKYQYLLQIPVSALDEDQKLNSMIHMMMYAANAETDNPNAEKFSAYSLKTVETEGFRREDILLYGISENSRYIPLSPRDGEVYISSAYADKYSLQAGDVIYLEEAYEDRQYDLEVTGVYDYQSAVCVFMNRKTLNRMFDLGENTYSGYFSDTEITDIPEEYIGSVIDFSSLTKLSRQLDVSMGSLMNMVDVFSVIMFVVLIYILSRIIIEKNAQSISMTKILGYTDREVTRIYMRATTVVTILSLTLSIPAVWYVLRIIFRIMLAEMMSGWIPLIVKKDVFVKMLALGFASYGAVALLEYRKITSIPMDQALKNTE